LKIPVLTSVTGSDYSENTDTQIAEDNSSNTNNDEYVSPYANLNSGNNTISDTSDDSDSVSTDIAEIKNILDTPDSASDDANTTEVADLNSSIVPEGNVAVTYKVKSDDSLLGIADLFNSRISDIRNWNNIPYTTTIKVGQTLTIYVPESMKDYYASLDKSREVENNSNIVSTKSNNRSSSLVYHKVRRGETLGLIAAKYGVGVNQIRDWNNISGNKIMSGSSLKIYSDGVSDYASSNETRVTNSNTNLYKYRVKRGDTISEIAEQFGVSVPLIRKWNKLSSNHIVTGSTLKIYSSSGSSSYGDKTTKSSSNINYYKVKSGDTIGEIAEKYDVRVSDIRKWNNMSSNKILAGESLKIYSDATVNDIPTNKKVNRNSSANYYTVKSGDSLYSIALDNKTTVAKIKSLNNLRSNKIVVGQKIRLY
jgi:membrane-bound lytic murein transglycosylase D